MRINKFIAAASGLSRRVADQAIAQGNVLVNGQQPSPGQTVTETDIVTLSGRTLHTPAAAQTIMLNKPTGYVVSRNGQGSQTIYDILPPDFHHLKPVGRLDKDSSGLLLLTNDGQLAQTLTHPSHQKTKIYVVTLNDSLKPAHRQQITGQGVLLEDGLSKFKLTELSNDKTWRIHMQEGRNRQIRRTFAKLGYSISSLHRTHFGEYQLGDVQPGSHQQV